MLQHGFIGERVLKQDAFGRIEKGQFILDNSTRVPAIRRMYTTNHWFRWLALWLARNEKKALMRLQGLAEQGGFPRLLQTNRHFHVRSFIEGESMHRCVDQLSHEFFIECKKLIKAMRKAGVCNNDLAKEANWLVDANTGKPAITDFQLALCFTNPTNTLLLSCAQDDLRHLLKHKRKYDVTTLQEKAILQKRSFVTRLWMATGKKIHRFITRTLLGWEDRNGPEERNI